MDDMFFTISPFLIPITGILAVFAYLTLRTVMRARLRELEIRERIAMIEKGLVPPPEVDPRGFDLMVLIAFTSNETSVAIGVGGFLVVMGIAFFINSLMESPSDPPYSASRSFGAPSSTPVPPAEPQRRD
jgi:hypothetical protein